MLRLITTRHYRNVLASLRGWEQRGAALLAEARELEKRALLAEQSSELYKRQAATWEARACKFIDQIGITDGKLRVPAMTEPVPPTPNAAQSVFRAMNVDSLPRIPSESVPIAAPLILGVSEAAAADAVAHIRSL